VIELPSGDALKGKEGARRFAAKHAEIDGQKRSVTLTSLEARTPGRYLATLEMTNRELATDALMCSLDVGSIRPARWAHRAPAGLPLRRRGRRGGVAPLTGAADWRTTGAGPLLSSSDNVQWLPLGARFSPSTSPGGSATSLEARDRATDGRR
jgi:hypothetical protein